MSLVAKKNRIPSILVLVVLMMLCSCECSMSAAEAERIAMEQLEAIGLAHKSHLMPHDLSAGQQQRVAIARALVMKPQILLLDEPLSSLDPIASGEVMDVLRKLKSEITLVMSTNNIHAASELADRIVVLDAGHVCEDGPVEDVLMSPRQETTRRLLSYMRDLHYTIESAQFDRPELNSRIEQFCNKSWYGWSDSTLCAARCRGVAKPCALRAWCAFAPIEDRARYTYVA